VQLRAFSLAEKQAPTNPEYMYWLGTFYRDGVATMKQPGKALELFGKACDSFDPFGCLAAGKLLLAKKTATDREQAHVYFQRACAAGVEDGCVGLKAAEAPLDSAPAPPQTVHPRSGCACHGEVAPGGGEFGMAAIVVGVLIRRRARRPR
jgi:TPR repeat protein